MWTEILGEDIYRIIDKGYCRLLVEKEEKILRQGIQGELLQLFQSNQLYYKGAISKVNFESFFRFFIQIGIDYIERNNKNRKILYTNRTENLAINIVKAIVKIPMRCLIYEIHEHKKCGKLKGTMYSSGVYHLNRSGIVESIDKNIIVVRLDKLNEQDEDFKNVNTLQLDCRNCSYELENLKEGTKIIFYYFPYNADVRPLKVENIYVINEKESNIDLTEKAGQLFNSYRDKADESIYARGKSGGVITTKDIEQATEFYILAGYEQSDAEDKAVEYMLRRDATYQRAIAAGYSVSDDEINDYLDDLKVTINDSINSEEAQALISQFGSEEGYWQHEFEVYKINLPIEKYLESLKQEYLKNSISTQSNNQEAEETIENYNRYIEEVQSELVKQEQYEIFE